MKRWMRRLIPKPVARQLRAARQAWFHSYARKSYSHEGEDLMLELFLRGPQGFYVDVGAHHPMRFSNTYRLYRRGWRGLNIDANPGSMKIFKRLRPRDMNVEAAVASNRQNLTYYIFNEPALNTLDRELALERASCGYVIDREVTLTSSPLWQLLDRYVPPGTRIDLLTVDVEGLDYDVLLSNDWSRYSPEFILAECIGCVTLADAISHPIAQLLAAKHYQLIAKALNTLFFRLALTGNQGGCPTSRI